MNKFFICIFTILFSMQVFSKGSTSKLTFEGDQASYIMVEFIEAKNFFSGHVLKYSQCFVENELCVELASFSLSDYEENENSIESDREWFRLTWEKATGSVVGGIFGFFMAAIGTPGNPTPKEAKMFQLFLLAVVAGGGTVGYQIGNYFDGTEFSSARFRSLSTFHFS